MATSNKVEFGISELHIGTYDIADDGTVTMGTPYHQKDAVSFAPEEQLEQNIFYADNGPYWSGYSGGSFEGDLEVAKFDDDFKKNFLGYKALTVGGLAIVKNAIKPNVYIAFQVEGDVEPRRAIFYNCSLGGINREFNTIEENQEPATETLSITCIGDPESGVTLASFTEDDAEYENLFTSPTVPELESE